MKQSLNKNVLMVKFDLIFKKQVLVNFSNQKMHV